MVSWPQPPRDLPWLLGRGSSAGTTGILPSLERRGTTGGYRYPRPTSVADAASTGSGYFEIAGGDVYSGVTSGFVHTWSDLEPGKWDMRLVVEADCDTGWSGLYEDIGLHFPRIITVATNDIALATAFDLPFPGGGLGYQGGAGMVVVKSDGEVAVSIGVYHPSGGAFTIGLELYGAKR